MRVGVGLPSNIAGVNGEQLLRWARQADEGPFSSLGVFDRLVYDSYDPVAVLAAAAAATNRIGLAESFGSLAEAKQVRANIFHLLIVRSCVR